MSKIIFKDASDDLQLVKSGETVNLYDDLKRIAFNGHDFVEIGGLYWATMNVGANNITDTGLYFQWGDTQGYTADQVGSGSGKKYFNWSTYKYCNGNTFPTVSDMTKYNSTDGLTTLQISDDAARANMGGLWRVPTKDEFVAFGAAVNTAWTNDYQGSSIAGLVCTDKTDSSKVLFFPANGRASNNNVNEVGVASLCWSSSTESGGSTSAILSHSSNESASWGGSFTSRCYGCAVRGVVG